MHPLVSQGLDFQQAAGFYRRLEGFMPPVPKPITPFKINGIFDIIETVDVVVLDAYGVLNIGQKVIPGAVEAVAGIRALGKKLHVLTNDASNSREVIVRRHARRGFDFDITELMSSADCLPAAVSRFPDITRWGVMAPPSWPVARLDLQARLLAEDAGVYDWAEGFIFLSCSCWQQNDQALLEAALARHPRPVVVGNPDVTAPLETGFSVEPGAIAEALHRAFAVPLALVGKPYPEVFSAVLNLYPHLTADRFLMVGDTPHTDVLGARAAGMRSLLLTADGYLRDRVAETELETSGIWPDYISRRLGAS